MPRPGTSRRKAPALAKVAEQKQPVGPETPGDFFDAWSYLDLNVDLQAAKTRDPSFDLGQHFLECGLGEGRSPSFLFDVGFVAASLARMDGAEATVSPSNAIERFLRLAPKDRFVPNRWFDPWTVRRIDGLATLSDYDAFVLYMTEGPRAGWSPNALFDEQLYRDRNPDVATAIASGQHLSGFSHYLVAGYAENRLNLPGIDEALAEKDVVLRLVPADAAVVWWHDEAFYRGNYEDVRLLIENGTVRSGLEHFLGAGATDGRIPHPAVHAMMRNLPGGDCAAAIDPRRLPQSPPMRPHAWPLIDVAAASRVLAHLGATGQGNAGASTLHGFMAPPLPSGVFDAVSYCALNHGADMATAFVHRRRHCVSEPCLAPGSNLFAKRTIGILDVAAWRSGIHVIGRLTGNSRQSRRAHALFAVLREARIPFSTIDASPLFDNKPSETIGVDRDRSAGLLSLGAPPASINLFVLEPDEVIGFALAEGTALFDGHCNVAFWSTELAVIPLTWRAALAAFDLILVATPAEAEAFTAITDRPVALLAFALGGVDIPSETRELPHGLAVALGRARNVVLVADDPETDPYLAGLDLALGVADIIADERPGSCLFVLPARAGVLQGEDRIVVADEDRDGVIWDMLVARAHACLVLPRGIGLNMQALTAAAHGVPVVGCANAVPGALDRDDALCVASAVAELGRPIGLWQSEAPCVVPDVRMAAARLLEILDAPADPRFAATAAAVRDALSAPVIGRALRAVLRTHAAFGAERTSDVVAHFVPIVSATKDECFDVPNNGLDPNARARHVRAALAPMFSVLTVLDDAEPAAIADLHDDLVAQSDARWEWCVATGSVTNAETRALIGDLRRRDSRITLHACGPESDIAAALDRALGSARGRFVVRAGPRDRLPPDWLVGLADAVSSSRPAVDHDFCLPCGVAVRKSALFARRHESRMSLS